MGYGSPSFGSKSRWASKYSGAARMRHCQRITRPERTIEIGLMEFDALGLKGDGARVAFDVDRAAMRLVGAFVRHHGIGPFASGGVFCGLVEPPFRLFELAWIRRNSVDACVRSRWSVPSARSRSAIVF